MILSRPIPLPTHGAIKFALAIVLAFGALALGLPLAPAALIAIVAVLLAGLALDAADSHDGGVIRLRDHALIDTTVGIALIGFAVVALCRGWLAPAAITLLSGGTLLWLRARTRYTSR